ncbi:hypothetical protein EV401DRAFT_1891866 [Pisolithus croceorrhizus]|nr:hypothetical protein EV401DRAFT_1891866 [Pisolithus croceorrhizus]
MGVNGCGTKNIGNQLLAAKKEGRIGLEGWEKKYFCGDEDYSCKSVNTRLSGSGAQDSSATGDGIHAHSVTRRKEDMAFVVISPFVPLSDTDVEQDPYPQFSILAGYLYYDKVEAPIVTHVSHLLAPFAKTPFKLDYIVKPVIHLLPLYKGSQLSHQAQRVTKKYTI